MTSVSTDRRFGVNAGAAIKVPVKAASTANLTLSGEQTVDGVALVTGDRILVKNQTAGANNGIYIVDSGIWTRAPDFDGTYDAKKGTLVHVTNGSAYARAWFEITTDDPLTIGTTSLTFTQTLLGDATTVSFTLNGTGAVATTVNAYLQDFKSATGFAPDATGATDASTALQNAINACNYLYIPDGTYLLNTGLTGRSNQIIVLSPNATLKSGANGITMLSFTSKSHCHVRGGVFDGGGQTTNVSTGVKGAIGILFDNCTFFSLKDVEVKKCGIKNSGAPTTDSTFGGFGIFVRALAGATAYGLIEDCYVHDIAGGGNNTGDGIYISGQNASISTTTKAVTIRDCRVSTVGRHCYTVSEGAATSVPTDIWFENCYGEKSALCGIDFEDGYDTHVKGCSFSACGNDQTYFDPATTYGATYRLLAAFAIGNSSKNLNIANAHSTGCYYALTWGGSNGMTLSDSKFELSTISDLNMTLARSPGNLRISNCEFASSGACGSLFFNNNAGEVVDISHCKFGGSFAYNQMLDVNFSDCYFADRVTGGATASVGLAFSGCTFGEQFFIGKTTQSDFEGCTFKKGVSHNSTGGDQNTFHGCTLKEYSKTFDGSSAVVVSTANDTITIASHGFSTGARVVYSVGGGTTITGLADTTAYFIIKSDANTVKLATTAANAGTGTAIDLTAVGTGVTHYLSIEPYAHDAISFLILDEIFKGCRVIGSGNVTAVNGFALQFDSARRIKVTDCELVSLNGAGFKVTNGNAAALLSKFGGNTIRSCTNGVLVSQGGIKDGVIAENYFESITGWCIDLTASSGTYSGLGILGNTAGANVTNGFRTNLSGTGAWDYCRNVGNDWHNAATTKQSLSFGNGNGYSDDNIIA